SPVLAADSRLFYFSAANGLAGSSHFAAPSFLSSSSGGSQPFLLLHRSGNPIYPSLQKTLDKSYFWIKILVS
ncbi:MAG: hypothetical protein ACLS8R_08590, partial [Anaeromassilibacillus sp.]